MLSLAGKLSSMSLGYLSSTRFALNLLMDLYLRLLDVIT